MNPTKLVFEVFSRNYAVVPGLRKTPWKDWNRSNVVLGRTGRRARRWDGPGKWWGLTRGSPRSNFGAWTGRRHGRRALRWLAADCSCASAAACRRPATARPGGPAVTWSGRGGSGEMQEGRRGLAVCWPACSAAVRQGGGKQGWRVDWTATTACGFASGSAKAWGRRGRGGQRLKA
jgi:hypothetical protein